MKHLIHFAFYDGDRVRVIDKDSEYYGQIGEVHNIIIHINRDREYSLDYTVILPSQKNNFGNIDELFAANSLEIINSLKGSTLNG